MTGRQFEWLVRCSWLAVAFAAAVFALLAVAVAVGCWPHA